MSARLLAVDDDEVVLRLLIDHLTHAGYDVNGVRSVAEARTLAMQGVNYDGLVLDLGLRDGDGRAIAALWPFTPALYVSGNADGAVVFPLLLKPFRVHELLAAVADLLERTPS